MKIETILKDLHELRENLNKENRLQPTVGQCELNADIMRRVIELLMQHIDRPPDTG